MDDGSITLLVALIVLIAFSAFFSASETAFSSLNEIRRKSRAEEGDTSAARVLAMAEKYDKLLSSILIGNNIVNIAAASIATAVSPVLSLLLTLFTPLTWLFSQWKKLLGRFVHSSESDAITEGELITMVSEAENDGELTDRESQLIRSAIEFDDVEVEEILTPRVDVVAVEDDISLEELAQTFAESGYSRLPVYHDTVDNIIGVVHEKDFYIARLKKTVTMEDLIAPTLYTTGSTQISHLLRTLRDGERRTAAEAAERELVPQSFAHKILKKLARAGFVEVARGAEGGCRLSAELNRVTLYDLMTAMGEDSRLSSCMDPTYSCPWRASHGGCTVHCHLTGIQEKLNAELKAHTLEDILGPAD